MNIKLDKNSIKNIAIFVIVLIIYNVLSFAIPFTHTPTFWGAYIFGTLAILLQIGVVLLAVSKADTVREKLYAFPIVKKGVVYLAVQLVISVAFSVVATFVENFPGWIIYAVSVVVLGAFAILVLLADTARDEVLKVEEAAERETAQIKTFHVNIESIMRRTEDKELLKLLVKLNEKAKYSDPVSCEELYVIETEITVKIDELSAMVRGGEIEYAKALTQDIINLLEDRNAQCKLFKRR